MKKQKKQLALTTETVRALDQVELAAAAGGYGKTAYVCSGKWSGCNGCDPQ